MKLFVTGRGKISPFAHYSGPHCVSEAVNIQYCVGQLIAWTPLCAKVCRWPDMKEGLRIRCNWKESEPFGWANFKSQYCPFFHLGRKSMTLPIQWCANSGKNPLWASGFIILCIQNYVFLNARLSRRLCRSTRNDRKSNEARSKKHSKVLDGDLWRGLRSESGTTNKNVNEAPVLGGYEQIYPVWVLQKLILEKIFP